MTRKEERLIVGLDIGSSTCTAIIAELARNDHLNITGFGIAASSGVQKGAVTNLEQASTAVARALEQAEQQAGVKAGRALVGISGSHVSSVNSRGVVGINRNNNEITYEDVRRVMDSSRSVSLPPQREILHAIPRTFVVDGQDGIREPLGMAGYRLEVETHIVTTAAGATTNLFKAVQAHGIEVEDSVLSSLATSQAVLTEAEKKMGVCLLDIGAGTTDLAIYIDGSVWHTTVIAVGGNQLTNDISIVMRTPVEAAERLKIEHGDASVTEDYTGQYADYYGRGPVKFNFPSRQTLSEEQTEPATEDLLEVESLEPGRKQTVTARTLNEVIHARVRQLFDMVQAEIKKSGYDSLIPAGLVITGGTAQLKGICSAATHITKMRARIGTPENFTGYAEMLGSPAYSSAVGLVLWGAGKRTGRLVLQEIPKRGGKTGVGVGKIFGNILREFLP